MKYIQYSIRLLEPMKLAGQGTQQGTVTTRSFIPGSAVRGALIGAFLRSHPELSIDESIPLREEFLTNTKFYNAYITQGNIATLPVPFIYSTTKEESRKKGDIRIQNRFTKSQQDSGEIVFGKNEFGHMEHERLIRVSVKKMENLHIQKAEEKGIENKMFRYQAVEREQVFRGYIQCEDRWVEDFKQLMKGADFYIGGSKGTGYGKCTIQFDGELSYDSYVNKLPLKRADDSEYIMIYAMSDLVLLDDYGMVTNHVSCKYLERELGIENLTFVKSYCDTSMTFGYNQKWRANAVQQTAVQAGSILVYRCQEGIENQSIFRDRIAKLEQKGVGLRKEEGYGQIFINPWLNQSTAVKIETYERQQDAKRKPLNGEEDKQFSYKMLFNNMQAEEQAFVERTIKQIRDKKAQEHIQFKLIPNKYAEIAKSGFRISKTQAKAIELLLRGIYGKRGTNQDVEGRRQISLYLTKQKNLTALEATMLFNDEKHPVSFKDFIYYMANGNAKLEQVEKNWKKKTQTAEEDFYECCFYLMELLAYCVQKEDK